MVRPIELTDAISKVLAIERMQQNARAIPEAAHQFHKEMNEKLALDKARTPQPAAPGDQIILHADEREAKERREDEYRQGDASGHQEEMPGDSSSPGDEKPEKPAGHIDIRI